MADIDVKSANSWHVADNSTIYEPARSNNFEFIIHGADRLLRAGIIPDYDEEGNLTNDASDFVTNGQEIVRLAVNKATVPHFTQQEIVISKGNTKTYYAGVMEFGDAPIDVIEYVGASSKSVLMAWQALSGKPITGMIGRASEYKLMCELIEYSPDYSEKLRTWWLVGCWVKGISEPEMSHENPDKRVITATIRFDRAYPQED